MRNPHALVFEMPGVPAGCPLLGQNLAVAGALAALGSVKFTVRVPAVSVRGETVDHLERLAKRARLPVSTFVDRLINDELDRLGAAKAGGP